MEEASRSEYIDPARISRSRNSPLLLLLELLDWTEPRPCSSKVVSTSNCDEVEEVEDVIIRRGEN
jgi:hypothetical protein